MSAPAGPARVPPDQRNVVTPDAYRLDPRLLGTPLARPWRRASAMAVDGLLVAILSAVPGFLLGLAAAVLLLRVSGRPAAGGYIRRSARVLMRAAGALLMFVMIVIGWDSVEDRLEERGGGRDARAADEVGGPPGTGGVADVRIAAEVALLTGASTEAEARRRAGRIVPDLRAAGMPDDEIRDLFTGLSEMPGRPWLGLIADSVLRSLEGEEPAGPGSSDSVVLAYAEALRSEDSARVRELRPLAAAELAADTLATLREEIRETEGRRVSLARRVERLEEELEAGPGILGRLGALADDLGLGLGWAGLYFTAFLTLWSGYTPGKRILGIRVIRLDGAPIGWWAAFERFGGYAAGIATGLLGFAQILWDRNRQAVHDKICETVVIRARLP